MALEVVMWQFRDGSLHPEMWLTSFFDKEDNLVCHLIGERSFNTICERSFWGQACTTGLGNPDRVNCPECRQLLIGARFNLVSTPARKGVVA